MTSGLALPRGRGDTLLAQRFGAERRSRAIWVGLWVLGAAAAFGALAPVVFRHVPFEPIDVAFRVVGASFVACGLVAWRRRPDNRSGLHMTATGFALFASPLLAQIDAPFAQTLGLLLPDLWVLFFVPLVLTLLTGGRMRTVMDRVLVGAVLLDLLVLAPLWLMFAPQEGNLLLIVDDPGVAEVVNTVQLVLFVAVPIGTGLVLGARWLAASTPGRRALLPGVAGAACLLLFALLLIIQLTVGVKWPPLFWLATCSLITVPVAFLAGLLRSRLARAGVADLFRDLRSIGPTELQAALGRVLGDPRLLLAFPHGDGLVDAEGRPVPVPGRGAGQAVTPVERDGERVAVLIYDRSLEDDPELVETIGVAAGVALENQKLHAEAGARLAELQASRERIVTAADAERRRIERNLHDGAQQRLVTLALQLSLIRREIRRDPKEAEELVSSASDELARSLEELRELARGIHPVALEHGLDVALEALAGRAAVPTSVVVDEGPRLPQPVEFAAYFVASEALANIAKHARASAATIRLRRSSFDVDITITDDGVGGADLTKGTGLRGLTDRVEALGGRLNVGSPAEGGTVVTATLPLRAPRPDPIA
jgi:signal transduction histidine kinase